MVDVSSMSEPNSQIHAKRDNNRALFLQQINHLGFGLLLMVAVALIMHVSLGANPAVVIIVILTICSGIHPITRYGFFNIGALLILLVMNRYVGFPLIGKLLFLQPLDSNLDHSIGSFAIVLIGVLSYLIAFMISSKVDLKRNILNPTQNPRQLIWISIIAMAIGCAAHLNMAFHVGKIYTGITVSNFFTPFLHLALIAAVAAELCQSERKRAWNYWVVAIILTEVAFAMVNNSRMALVEIVMCYMVTVTAFRGKVRWARMVFVGLAVLLLVIVVTPVILHVRSVRDQLTWTQRIAVTIKAASDWRSAVGYYKAIQQLQKQDGFYLDYYGSPQNILDRMGFIDHVDATKSATEKHSTVGTMDLGIALKRALPRIIAPDKHLGYSHGTWLNCRLNIECVEGGYATVPLIANGYAAFGWFGACIYPILLGVGVLLMIKLVSGYHLMHNIWGIYLFIRVHNSFVEGDSATYLQHIIRDIPQDVVVLVTIAFFSGIASSVFHKT